MFAPRYGIAEESATGMAAGPLACFLNDHMGQVKEKYEIEQGYSMNPSSPSCINVVLSKEGLAIRSLKAGGTAAITRFEEIEIQWERVRPRLAIERVFLKPRYIKDVLSDMTKSEGDGMTAKGQLRSDAAAELKIR